MPTLDNAVPPEVVCFGMITPARVIVVDKLPDWNTGAIWTDGAEFVSDDAAIVAGLLSQWGMRSDLVGTALGNDDAGRRTIRMLEEMGVGGSFVLRDDIETPLEIDVSDSRGGRTFYWNRRPEVMATLDDAPLIGLSNAELLYLDWYDRPHILRPMSKAASLGIPVYLNLEYGHSDPEVLSSLSPYTTICQATTDEAQRGTGPVAIVDTLVSKGISTVLVTLASGGVVGRNADEMLHVRAPQIEVVDVCGAGATFSAGFIASRLGGLGFEDSLRFAVAAASLKCGVVGPVPFPKNEIDDLARTLEVRRLT